MTSQEPALPGQPPRVSRSMLRHYRALSRVAPGDADITALAHAGLAFNAPMSDARVHELAATLQPLQHARIIDLGCGWAELLIRLLDAEPTAGGVGVDTQAAAVERGRAAAAARGLSGRVRLEIGDATKWSDESGDVLLCIGSSHCWAGTRPALLALRRRLRPGGRLLFGEGYWVHPPGPAALAALDTDPADLCSLADLAGLAVDCGYRVLSLATASTAEWDAYESGWCGGLERWLLSHPSAPGADRVRATADAQREAWLRGRRGTMGFAYLTLGVRP